MADISNKTLSIFLFVGLFISIAGTILVFDNLESPTGFVLWSNQQTGISNFTINNSLSIQFSPITVVPFGSGYVNSSMGNCTIGTNMTAGQITAATSGCIGFNSTVGNMNLTIENNGNMNCNVSLNFSSNATGFITGVNPSYKYLVQQNESASCTTIMNGTGWTEVGLPNTLYTVCKNLTYINTNDSFTIALWLAIPSIGVTTGVHTTNIYAIGCDDGSC